MRASQAILFLGLALGATTSAQAIVLGGCPSPLRPPPCIILDGGKIAQTIAEVNQKRQELQQLVGMVNEMRSVAQGIGGNLSNMLQMPTPATTSLNVASLDLSRNMNDVAGLMIPSTGQTPTDFNRSLSNVRNMQRNATLDGYGLALHVKQKLDDYAREADALQRELDTKSTDQRHDWQLNSKAQMLLAKIMTTRRELEIARLTLRSSVVNTTSRVPPNRAQSTPAPTSAQAAVPIHGAQLDAVKQAFTQVQSLQNALQTVSAMDQARAIVNETLTEFGAIQQTAQATDARLRQASMTMAAEHNNRTGRRMTPIQIQNFANQLYNTAIGNMTRLDGTGWADENKGQVQVSAASNTWNTIDRMISQRPVNGFEQIVIDRMDAQKQTAYFTPIVQDARANLSEIVTQEAALYREFGITSQTVGQLNTALAAAQNNMNAAMQAVQTAPEDVQTMARGIISQ